MPRYAQTEPARPSSSSRRRGCRPACRDACQNRRGVATDRLARIDKVLQQYVDDNRIPGAVALVLRDGRPIYDKAFGWSDKESSRKMATDSIFRIASQSKALTSVAILILMEEGALTLATPVSQFIPTFAKTTVAVKTGEQVATEPAKRAINIKDLLTHTAGISYGTDATVSSLYEAKGLGPAAGYGWYTADKDEPVCDTMERLGTLPFVAQPGEAYVYGYNTDILGCVVERASGMPLDQFIARRITGAARDEGHALLPPGRSARRASRPSTRAARTGRSFARLKAHAGRGITSTARARASPAAPAWSRRRATTRASSR